MILKKINIVNLRNHKDSEIELSPNLNVFYGLNGAGKTTILEATSILSFSRTFLPTIDANLIKKDEEYYHIAGQGIADSGFHYKASVTYKKNMTKKISNSDGDNLIPKEILGRIPAVILSPDFKAITFGSPSERRSFINRILSQINPIYSTNILKLKKILKQRNNLLAEGKKGRSIDENFLEVLTDTFLTISSEIMLKRKIFTKDFFPYFVDSYSEVSCNKENVKLEYEPDALKTIGELETKEEIFHLLKEKAAQIKNQELRRGTTLIGPQKDELGIYINDFEAKENASQGQHKSLLIALKFAEFKYMSDILKETPVILFDDIFTELDFERSRKVISFINENKAQTFITITNTNRLKSFDKENKHTYFYIDNGNVKLKDKL